MEPKIASPVSGSPPAGRALVPVLMAATMVAGIVSSLGAPLLPDVAKQMHVTLDDAQWSLTVALLAGAIAAPTLGRLGDGRYQREAIIGDLVLVFIGSIIAGFADSFPVLIVGRLMQGTGLGLAPVTMAAARAHIPADRSGQVIATLSVMGAAGIGAGYPLSGLIASDVSLHAAFFLGAVLSGAAGIAAVFAIPSNRHSATSPLDVRGVGTIALGLTALLVGISQGQTWGWGSVQTIGAFVIAISVLSLFAVSQLHHDQPLVDLRQLRHRSVLTANVAAMALGASVYMYFTVLTEFVQAPESSGYGFGASSLVAGFVLVPFSVISLVCSRITGPAVARLGARTVLMAGGVLTALSGVFFALAHQALWEAFVATAILGVAFGFSFAAIPGMVTRAVPAHDTGSAMGLYQVIRSIGFSVGSALTASMIAAYIVTPGGLPTKHGYVLALWVGSAIAIVAVIVTLVLARGSAPSTDALGSGERARVGADDAALAAAGLVGLEGDEAGAA